MSTPETDTSNDDEISRTKVITVSPGTAKWTKLTTTEKDQNVDHHHRLFLYL
ncbi:hypothetical protein C2G38_2184601 [Gigaspora rosea]|uniref:Uncharacterized protein n=1 Tax=Gigaspora rosea TaxID=44941 RepID=A0A397V9R8_9GLOM|nr:hypothetical protein C2G38_2184601 [Gigaspora rosea]